MLPHILLVAHIVVLGYWLGSELVINSTYRYVAYGGDIPFDQRDRLMEHVMDKDQHVRYALVLQAGLGFTLATLYGYVPGGTSTAWGIAILAVLWLAFVEIVHRVRHGSAGKNIATIDRWSRYALMILLLALALGVLGHGWNLPFWLRLKLGFFACAMACGVGIRIALIAHFRTWAIMRREGASDATNAIIRATYVRGTSVLLLLWVFIAAIVTVSVLKPM